MPTTKQRINITATKDMGQALRAIAKRDRVPVASKAAELLKIALELEEDFYWGKIAEERMNQKNIKWIPEDKFWKMVRARNSKK